METTPQEQVQQKLMLEQQGRGFYCPKEERDGHKKQRLQDTKYILELENIQMEHLEKFS